MTELSFAERASSRKFIIVVVALCAGTGLQLLGQLSDEWVSLTGILITLYYGANIGQKALTRKPGDADSIEPAQK